MRNFQDTFETRKQSFIIAFPTCMHDCTFKIHLDHCLFWEGISLQIHLFLYFSIGFIYLSQSLFVICINVICVLVTFWLFIWWRCHAFKYLCTFSWRCYAFKHLWIFWWHCHGFKHLDILEQRWKLCEVILSLRKLDQRKK